MFRAGYTLPMVTMEENMVMLRGGLVYSPFSIKRAPHVWIFWQIQHPPRLLPPPHASLNKFENLLPFADLGVGGLKKGQFAWGALIVAKKISYHPL